MHLTLTLVSALLLLHIHAVSSNNKANNNNNRRGSQGPRRQRVSTTPTTSFEVDPAVPLHSSSVVVSGRYASTSSAKCVDIPQNMSLCRGIGYTQMRLPNLLDHETLTEATQQAASWVPLLPTRCHANTQLFLCSLFSPVCLDRPIWPCRSLCEAVKGGCERHMMRHGFPWPEMLRCDKFPTDNDLCIGLHNNDDKQTTENQTCPACSQQPVTTEELVQQFCASEVVAKYRPGSTVVSGDDVKLKVHAGTKKTKLFRGEDLLHSTDRRRPVFFVQNGAHCDCFGFGGSQTPLSPSPTSQVTHDEYLVMGKKVQDRLIVSHVHRFDSKAPAMRRALREFRRPDACKPAGGPVKIGGGKVGDHDNGDELRVTKIGGKKNKANRKNGGQSAGEQRNGERRRGQHRPGEHRNQDHRGGEQNLGERRQGERRNNGDRRVGEHNVGEHRMGDRRMGEHRAGEHGTGEQRVDRHRPATSERESIQQPKNRQHAERERERRLSANRQLRNTDFVWAPQQ